MADDRLPIRKAVPPRAFRSSAQFDGRNLDVTVAYDSGNGPPVSAILVRVELSDERWQIPRDVEFAIPDCERVQLPRFCVATRKEPCVAESTIRLQIPWPEETKCGLLLLLHNQVPDLADLIWDRFPGDAATMAAGTIAAGIVATASDVTDEPTLDDKTREDLCKLIKELKYLIGRLDMTQIERGIVTRRMQPGSTDPSPRVQCAESGPLEQGAASVRDPAFRFALASCQYPAGVVDGGIRRQERRLEVADVGPAEESLFCLAERAKSDSSIELVVLAGDQVYVDATAGMFDAGVLLDHLDFAYERMLRNRGMQALLRTEGIAVVPIIDDHEIEDNWEPKPPSWKPDDELCTSRQRYLEYQRVLWPQKRLARDGLAWGERKLHGFDFFFADTRTEREGRCLGNLSDAKIMSDGQMTRLLEWLTARDEGCSPGFVVSPSILLPRRLSLRDQWAAALHADSWCGYPASFHLVLAQLYDADARRVVFLSGDEHISCVARIEIERLDDARPGKVVAHSVHSSALYAPFPFANSTAPDFAEDDKFEFDVTTLGTGKRHYRCTVKTWFPPPLNGYAVLRPHPNASGWDLDIEFCQRANNAPHPVQLG